MLGAIRASARIVTGMRVGSDDWFGRAALADGLFRFTAMPIFTPRKLAAFFAGRSAKTKTLLLPLHAAQQDSSFDKR